MSIQTKIESTLKSTETINLIHIDHNLLWNPSSDCLCLWDIMNWMVMIVVSLEAWFNNSMAPSTIIKLEAMGTYQWVVWLVKRNLSKAGSGLSLKLAEDIQSSLGWTTHKPWVAMWLRHIYSTKKPWTMGLSDLSSVLYHNLSRNGASYIHNINTITLNGILHIKQLISLASTYSVKN